MPSSWRLRLIITRIRWPCLHGPFHSGLSHGELLFGVNSLCRSTKFWHPWPPRDRNKPRSTQLRTNSPATIAISASINRFLTMGILFWIIEV